MIEATRAVFLHQVKYSETSVVATVYTEAFGRQAYIIQGVRNTKSKRKAGLLQPLFLLEIEAYHKPGREVQQMKDFRLDTAFRTLPFDVSKSALALFLAEILYKTIRNEEPDPPLFHYIYHSILLLDRMEKGTANFHLWFLTRLLPFLGFQPENNFSPSFPWFDLKNGRFLQSRPLHPVAPSLDESALLSKLFDLDQDDLHTFRLTPSQRKRLLELLIEYYSIHSDSFGKIHSAGIFHDLFQ